eukprot:Gb_41095 [translate_table: standard]
MCTEILSASIIGNPCCRVLKPIKQNNSMSSKVDNLRRVQPNNGDIFPFPFCTSISPWIPSLRLRIRRRRRYWVWPKSHVSKKYIAYLERNSSLDDGSETSAKGTSSFQLNWDSPEDLFGVGTDMEPRNITFSRPEPRSWFGPNGQYVKELPCPSCRGRGYMLCTECKIDRSRPTCLQCHGKWAQGLRTCRQCLGECVIWEESIDELPWEKACTSSPLNVVEDDEIDKLEIHLAPERKSKRVYASPPPEVSEKISRALRNLNAVTGLFSKRMKKLHSDPVLHAQRVAAMKVLNFTAATVDKRVIEGIIVHH